MTRRPDTNPLWKMLLLGRSDLSWAGPSEDAKGFCFGTEDGMVFWTDFEGKPRPGHPPLQTPHRGEAINGVAYQPGWMVVTTAAGCSCWRLRDTTGYRLDNNLPAGAHGVTSGSGGHFYLPMGPNGLLRLKTGTITKPVAQLLNPTERDFNFYRATPMLGSRSAIACACRKTGLVAGAISGSEKIPVENEADANDDYIDVCSVPGPRGAVCALTRDCKFVVFGNGLADRRHGYFRYGHLQGTAYRVLATETLVCVLTDSSLRIMGQALSPELEVSLGGWNVPSLEYSFDAIDIGLVGERWLLVLLTDRVARLDLARLGRELSESVSTTLIAKPHVETSRKRFGGRELLVSNSPLVRA